jgi:hypothetical protein
MHDGIYKCSLDVVWCLKVEPDRITYVKVDYLLARGLVFARISDNVTDSILYTVCPI